jgi:D-amino peptidase
MDLYFVVDMEGISGISGETIVRVGHEEWASRGRHLATAEVNAAIAGAIRGGAKRIWVKDGHDLGQNLLVEDLNGGAELIYGSTSVVGQMPGLDGSFDAVFLIGFHARMGTYRAQMDHTITTAAVSEIRLNDIPVGEIGIYAAYAGYLGVPVVLVSGDHAATQEARDLLGGTLTTVSVQQALGRFSGRLLSPQEVHLNIEAAAEKALKGERPRPWLPSLPLKATVDFLRSAEADMAEMVPGASRMGARTVQYSHDDPKLVFKSIQAMVHLGAIAARRWATIIYTTGARA